MLLGREVILTINMIQWLREKRGFSSAAYQQALVVNWPSYQHQVEQDK